MIKKVSINLFFKSNSKEIKVTRKMSQKERKIICKLFKFSILEINKILIMVVRAYKANENKRERKKLMRQPEGFCFFISRSKFQI